MDERIFSYKKGKPIPDWDILHRLPTDKPVGPECRDTGTIFRVNSTWMDVTDQPFRSKHMTGAGVFACLFGVVYCVILLFVVFSRRNDGMDGWFYIFHLFLFCGLSCFLYFAFKGGRDEFFSLKRRPIRFNRKEQKIYAIRRRRFFGNSDDGDVTWEIPWNSQSIFCIHKNPRSADKVYHIRHYAVDDAGNVLRAFSIGRQWDQNDMQSVLSQWNYWCEYMSQGPAHLPSPLLYFSEEESIRESFLFCTYNIGFAGVSLAYILFLPILVGETIIRRIALATSRCHIWPKSVESVSAVDLGDAYDQPRGETPIGWAATGTARGYNQWPLDPKCDSANWHGEKDAVKNAELWKQDIPPIFA